ncbi:LSU ribosomal protein L17p [hydrothermal vent metagenome]|uniref:LSU ribosomal protein L17p n=1 Tax=hydrothermal vent metagenome TaxID=652676 RepID=A0A3B1DK57_9ZZZZ
MRHGIVGNTLNRKSSHRKATVRDIAKAALIQERICTTKAKAKEARKLVDKLITLGKKGTLADKRRAFSILCDHKLVSDLFKNTSPRFKNRIGGYTRIIPIGNRRGDNAELAFLELTEKSEIIITKPRSTAKTTDIDVTPTKATTVKTESKTAETVKISKPNKADVKDQAQKLSAPKDKAKQENLFGGIRKMFNKKSSGK